MSAHSSRGKAFGLFVVVSAALVLSGAVLLMCTGLRHPEKWRSVAGNICSPKLGQVRLELTVEPGEPDTWFSCGANPPAVLQPSQQGMVFEGTSCQTTRSLSSVSAGAKLHTKVDGGQTWYRLDIPSKERKNRVLCYTCKQALPHEPKNRGDGALQIGEPVFGRTCTVRITLEASTNRQLQYKAEEDHERTAKNERTDFQSAHHDPEDTPLTTVASRAQPRRGENQEEGQGEAAAKRNEQTGEEAAPQRNEQTGEEAAPQRNEQTGEEAATKRNEQTGEEAATKRNEQTGEEAAPQRNDQTGEEAAPQRNDQTGEEAATKRNGQTGEKAASNDDLKVTVCSQGTVPVTVAQGAPLAFQCAAGMLLEPKGGQEAFDGDCNNHAPLTSFVDASLETQSLTTQNDAQTTYKLRVTNSPVTPVSICYKCVYRVDAAEYVSEQCHLKISVIPTAHADAPARGMTLVSIGLLGLIWLSSM
ncbi:hypothetical protein BESB_034050 [Besnoitia besnoiti]|uniref:SRS domain-containing protein n=1 Tax=Besnoitia besnoiti TaxID=94643 RepID=A0A2A9MMF5_BESBE|nr:hypothetical protein BESB_034050 [Besnoitia besnoiti]PFH36947.1 hypothetical protein BESB_034050 [Besnoitia besnoiti]